MSLGQDVVRLTLNPALISLSEAVVNWRGRPPDQRLHPSDLIVRARRRFPRLPLSWAVEGDIVLLLLGDAARLAPFSVEPHSEIPRPVRRFASLSLSEKTRVLERWKQTLQKLRGARDATGTAVRSPSVCSKAGEGKGPIPADRTVGRRVLRGAGGDGPTSISGSIRRTAKSS